jgi:hypothetical protein
MDYSYRQDNMVALDLLQTGQYGCPGFVAEKEVGHVVGKAGQSQLGMFSEIVNLSEIDEESKHRLD